MSDYTITRTPERVSIDIPTAGRTIGVDMLPGREADAAEPAIELLANNADRYGRHPLERERVRQVATRAFGELLNG